MESQTEQALLTMYTIYYNPSDAPGKYVVRKFNSRGPTLHASEHATLAEARAKVPPGLFCFPRHAKDERQIVETWI